jgi:hypothetical protein
MSTLHARGMPKRACADDKNRSDIYVAARSPLWRNRFACDRIFALPNAQVVPPGESSGLSTWTSAT